MSHSIADRTAHLAAWDSSGLSQAAYCRQAGLGYHLLRDWVRRRSAEQDVPSGFVEVRRPATGVMAVLTLSGGARVEFSAQSDPTWAAQVISSVVASC